MARTRNSQPPSPPPGTRVPEYTPFVPADQDLPEFTLRAVLLGVVMAVILGSANAYIGLKAGLTVAATFPAAVVGMAALRMVRGSILEENMARTVASVGEALVAGAIFTIPAFKIAGVWDHFNYFESTAIMLTGGVMGVLFVVLLRRILVEESGLPFPESVAAGEIHKAGQKGGSEARTVLQSGLVGAGILALGELSIMRTGWTWFRTFGASTVQFIDDTTRNAFYSHAGHGGLTITSPGISPALFGVGYIIGPQLASITFCGAIFAWGLLVPLLLYLNPSSFADLLRDRPDLVADEVALSRLVFANYVKPIAVGGMLVGAASTLWKMKDQLIGGMRRAFGDISAKGTDAAVPRTGRDLPFRYVFAGVGVSLVGMFALYYYFISHGAHGDLSTPRIVIGALVATLVMGFAGFVFSAIAGYLVGLIGSSNNPISGLTLSTLIVAALLLLVVGVKGDPGVTAVLGVAAVVCCICGVAGDMMQDLKVGHILGGTPKRMEMGEIIGVVAAASVLVIPIMLLDEYGGGIGSEKLPAPQAGLMAMLARGIVGGEMAWPLVIVGMFMGVGLLLIRAPAPMLIAVGMYLPFYSTAAIFLGGVAKAVTERLRARRNFDAEAMSTSENRGILLASGLVAGEALMALVLTGIKAARPASGNLLPDWSAAALFGAAFGWFAHLLAVVILVALLWYMIAMPLKGLGKRG
ncbi:MAG: oligopeptide transporter, OPT family [Candidatus Krumholzibacteriia bacterium]